MWKKFAIGNVVVLVVSVIISCCFLFPARDAIADWVGYYEFAEFAADKTVRTMDEETELLANKDHYIEAMEEGKIGVHYDLEVYIGEVRWDGGPLQQGSMYQQSFWITDVVSGTAEAGRQITLYMYGGFTVMNDEAVFIGTDLYKNVMKPGNTYLVFCEKLEYQDSDELVRYRVIPGLLNVLCLNQDDEPYRSNDEITDTWAQFSDRELLTDSNELISEFNELKQAMFDKWGIDRTIYLN